MRKWAANGYNIACATGALSNIIALDIDGGDGWQSLKEKGIHIPVTPRVQTSPGHEHAFFLHPGGRIKNAVRFLPGLDIRGDGGFILVPPSVHPDGHIYESVPGFAFSEVDVAPVPEGLMGYLSFEEGGPGKAEKAGKGGTRPRSADPGSASLNWETFYAYLDTTYAWLKKLWGGVPKGQRNVAATKVAGHFLGAGWPEVQCLEILTRWNLSNRPPLNEKELSATWASIRDLERKKRAQKEAEVTFNGLEAVSQTLGVDISKITHTLGDEPAFLLTIEGVMIELNEREITSIRSFEAKVAGATKRMIRRPKGANKTDVWRGLVQGMLDNAQTKINLEAYTVTHYEQALRDYLRTGDRWIIPHQPEGVSCLKVYGVGFHKTGIFLKSVFFKEYLFKRGENPTLVDVAKNLRKLGLKPAKIDDIRLWKLSDKFIDEELKAAWIEVLKKKS